MHCLLKNSIAIPKLLYLLRTSSCFDNRGLGGPVVRPLATSAKGPGFDSPDCPARSDKYFSGLYVRHSWFTGIELVLGLKN